MGFWDKIKGIFGNDSKNAEGGSLINSIAGKDNSLYLKIKENPDIRQFSLPNLQTETTSDGFCMAWGGDWLVAYNLEGSRRWQLDWYARCFAIMPGGARLVAAGEWAVAMVDIYSGEQIGEPVSTQTAIEHLVWTKKGIFAADSDQIYRFSKEGELLAVFAENLIDGGFIGGLCATSDSPQSIVVLDANEESLIKIDVQSGAILKKVLIGDDADRLFCSSNAKTLMVTCGQTVRLFDGVSLKELSLFRVDGKMGLEIGKGQDKTYMSWEMMPDLSPDGKLLLVNDPSGQLHLFDVQKGTVSKTFQRSVFGQLYVCGTKWLDNEAFVVMLAGGQLCKMNIHHQNPIFRGSAIG